jgi:WD40 repeat protein
LLAVGESGRSANIAPPAATVLTSVGVPGGRQLSIQIGRLDGTGATQLTRKVAKYEIREDWEASFSPDGTRVAFVRESKRDPSSVMIVNSDGTGIRHVLTLARAKRIAPGAKLLRSPLFTTDGRSLVVAAERFCSTEAVVVAGLDGSPPAVWWRRPTGANVGVYPQAFLPDGTLVAVASQNDGDCYYDHTGPDRLILISPGSPPRTLGPPSDAVDGVLVAPDGRTVVWAAGCYEICQLWSANVDTGTARQLTRFRTRTAALEGYDSVTLAALGEDAFVYGRGRSIYARRLSRTDAKRIAHFPCRRKIGCALSEISSIATSPDGTWMIVRVTDYGCEICRKGSPGRISELFAVRTASGQRIKLPLLDISDLHFE